MTDKEIYQTQVAKEELEAAKIAVVNFYRYTETDEVTTRCQSCFNGDEASAGLEYIDKAADWDECAVCGAQNIPTWYHGDGPSN